MFNTAVHGVLLVTASLRNPVRHTPPSPKKVTEGHVKRFFRENAKIVQPHSLPRVRSLFPSAKKVGSHFKIHVSGAKLKHQYTSGVTTTQKK